MILVAGATGLLGGMITRRLLAGGERVRILVRPGSPFEPLVAAGAEAVHGDLKDPPSLAEACRGVGAVVTTANSAARGGPDTPATVDRDGNRNLVEAARAAGAERLVYVSALVADSASPDPFTRAKGEAEDHLRGSGLPYSILAPTVFMEVWIPMIVGGPVAAGEPVTLMGEARRRHSFISVEDVARFAVAAVRHPMAENRRIPLGGPEALSWRDVVASFERATGRSIPLRFIPPGALLPGLPEVVSGLMTALEMADTAVDMEETAALFGVSLTRVEEYVRRLVTAGPALPHP